MGKRAITPVVGMTILLGIAAVLALSILVVSGSLVDDAQSSAETQQVEYSMAEFSQTADRLSRDETSEAQYTAVTDSSGVTSVNDSAGHIEVTLVTDTGAEETLMADDLGVYKEELQDGTVVAFQGGGVWRYADGETILVDPPSFQYRNRPEPTLTFPHVRLKGQPSQGDVTSGRLRVLEQTDTFPGDGSNPVEGQYVYVDLQSKYCQGWETHIDERTDGHVEEACSESVNTSAPNEMRVNLTVADPQGRDLLHDTVGIYSGDDILFESTSPIVNATMAAKGNVTWGSGVTEKHAGDIGEEVGPIRAPHDSEIYGHVNDADPSDWETFCQTPNCDYEGNQTLYIDDWNGGGGSNVAIDVGEGDLNLVVDDDLNFTATTKWDIDNDSTGNSVNVYTTGDIHFKSTTDIGPDGGPDNMYDPVDNPPSDINADALHFYAASDATITVGSTVKIEGTISAPSTGTSNQSEADIQGTSFYLAGSLYAGDVRVWDGTPRIYQDPETGAGKLSEIEAFSGPEPELYYLHLSKVLLEID